MSTFNAQDSALIAELYELSKSDPKLVKSSDYPAPQDPDVTITSWRMNEFKYYDVPSPFPTYARGIFTRKGEEEGGYRIVARGYDKFFSTAEVGWTHWKALEDHTEGPYTLSLKSNGCIIFIAALSPTKLLVTSKHSIGPSIQPGQKSHSEEGERWMNKCFAKVGKTQEEFAAFLWENNWTAIAELCDDEFEEHVLAYPPEMSGLHLHGLNVNTKDFVTLPQSEVDTVADAWGFIKTVSTTLNSVDEVKTFTDKVGETGVWNGEALEGFVVRCRIVESKSKSTEGKPPYPPGSTFFWKIKFDEPYMMYRDWREATKKLISASSAIVKPGQPPKDLRELLNKIIPKSKMKRAETRVYVGWVIEQIEKDTDQFEGYQHNKGIIATRKRFLDWFVTEAGQTAFEEEKAGKRAQATSAPEKKDGPLKTIIVPVAIPGCGKTSIAVALAHLFQFGHTQSDDVHIKKSAPLFVKNVVSLLKNHDVVIADKNNHLKQHRTQLREAAAKYSTPVQLLALNWHLEIPLSKLHRICGDRVYARGENHQSLRADKETKAHEDVVWMFITGRQELADSEVDVSVDMVLEETFEQTLNRAIDACVQHIPGLTRPAPEAIREALELAQGYTPTTKKQDGSSKGPLSAQYYALVPEMKILEVVDPVVPKDDAFWGEMKAAKRVMMRPHVTMAHWNSKNEEEELWNRCVALHKMAKPPLFRAKLGHFIHDGKAMALTVDEFDVESEGSGEGVEGREFVSSLKEELGNRLHITVGTKEGTNAVEAGQLVQAWRKNPSIEGVKLVQLEEVVVFGRIKGVFAR